MPMLLVRSPVPVVVVVTLVALNTFAPNALAPRSAVSGESRNLPLRRPVAVATLAVTDTISLGAMRPWTAAEQGEQLFYDARLSLDGWFSCHSCHVDGHTNHRLNDNLGDDSFGAPKRVLSLLGVAKTEPWQWNGSQATLHGQIRKSMQMTMRGGEVAANDPRVAALEAYLQTLAPPPSLTIARQDSGDTASESTVATARAAAERGQALFQRHACVECHQPPTYTSRQVWDVGLTDEQGERKFNPPALRGLSQRGLFFTTIARRL